jgi:hypothetical protein
VLSTESIAAKLIIFYLRTSFDLIPCVVGTTLSWLFCGSPHQIWIIFPDVEACHVWELCVDGNQVQSGSKSLPHELQCVFTFFLFLFYEETLAVSVQKNKLEMSLASCFTHNRTASKFQNLMVLEISPYSDPVVTMGGVEWLVNLQLAPPFQSFIFFKTNVS